MKWTTYTSRQETIANILLWSVMLIVPLMGVLGLSSVDEHYSFRWVNIWHIWRPMLVILLAFLIHNYFIAPQLIYKGHHGRYAALLTLLVIAFAAHQCTSGPPAKPPVPDSGAPQQEATGNRLPPMPMEQPPRFDRPGPMGFRHKPLASPHNYTMFSLLVFALGANLGTKLFFKTQRDRQHLAELERENLRQELIYLRYQVNPHFLMNTLNNIHALVDIDPAEAKNSIVHLSKFMRYLLYESDKKVISLAQAIDLINQYIDLMSKRYAKCVDIRFDAPQQIPNIGLAPLILIPFIENAFKHGVSYDKPSYIHLSLRVDTDTIKFDCANSINHKVHEHGGVGLNNVIKRLDLIYGKRYTLHIDDSDPYIVSLTVPADSLSATTGQPDTQSTNN